jgi:hypothetical protein
MLGEFWLFFRGHRSRRLLAPKSVAHNRSSGMSGNETQRWRALSHTPIVGGGRFGSAKLLTATPVRVPADSAGQQLLPELTEIA